MPGLLRAACIPTENEMGNCRQSLPLTTSTFLVHAYRSITFALPGSFRDSHPSHTLKPAVFPARHGENRQSRPRRVPYSQRKGSLHSLAASIRQFPCGVHAHALGFQDAGRESSVAAASAAASVAAAVRGRCSLPPNAKYGEKRENG